MNTNNDDIGGDFCLDEITGLDLPGPAFLDHYFQPQTAKTDAPPDTYFLTEATAVGRGFQSHPSQMATASPDQFHVPECSYPLPESTVIKAEVSLPARDQHRRGYQACQPCRQRKVKCDLGSRLPL